MTAARIASYDAAMILEARAPTRIDLAGGTLDIWPLYLLVDRAVTLNVAIDLYARCRLETDRGRVVRIESRDGGVAARFASAVRMRPKPGLELIAALVSHFRPRTGFRLVTDCAAPAGSGLGGSSALAVALGATLARAAGQRLPRARLVEICRDLEARVIGAATGTQDYLAAVHGGWNRVEYGPGPPQVTPLPAAAVRLEDRLLLYYTGRSRASARGNRDMVRRCLEGRGAARTALAGVSMAAAAMDAALRRGDLGAVAAAMRSEWRWRRRLSPEVGRGGVESLIRRARAAGALAGKPCGAGGGGCVVLLCGAGERDRVARALDGQPGRLLPFRVVRGGLRLRRP